MGQKRFGPVDDAPEVHVHQPLEVPVAHAFNRAGERHASVVEDQIDLSVLLSHGVGPGIYGFPVCDVDSSRGHMNTSFARLLDGLLQAFLVQVGQRQIAIRAPQLDRQRAADAGPRARNGGYLVFEAFHDPTSFARAAILPDRLRAVD